MNKANVARNFLDPTSRLSHSKGRGAILSHLIGLSFFGSFLLEPAFPKEILFTKPFDWPIRLIALWLLLNRFGKQKTLKFSPWDITHLLFVAGFGFALIYAELFMVRDTGLINYVKWMNTFFNGYLYFLVVREGLSRRGFDSYVLVRWMVATFFVICLVALAQAKDFAGTRVYIDTFYHQQEIEAHMQGPSAPWQARAPASHANSLVIMLLCGLPLFIALWDMAKFKWFDWVTLLLVLVTIFMTYSRIGVIALAATGFAVIALLSVRRDYKKAATAAFVVATIIVGFAIIVTSFDVGRFKVLFESSAQASLSQAGKQDTSGWRLRQESLKRSIELGENNPVFGVMAASGANNQSNALVKNSFTYQGLLLNVYAFAFVSYGLLGLAFIFMVLWLLLSQVRFARTRQVFAGAAFVLAITLMAAGIAENDLFFDGAMLTTNIIAAFCIMRVSLPPEVKQLPTEEERVAA
ncbi:MAG TPA: O-antigen ligase family protein [Fimbriimonadaceae bacterium]